MSDVTIYTLAEELNMTPSMISRALNPEGKISKEKRKIVLAAAEKHNFHLNRFASRLSLKPIQIGILIRCKFKINAEKMIEGIRLSYNELKDYKVKYDVSLFDDTVSDNVIFATLDRYRQYDGIILTGMSAPRYTAFINELYQSNPNIVQVQSVNKDASCLFGSKHDEKVAAGLAADFLHNCLRYSQRKNILLFTGDLSSSVHLCASSAFREFCNENDMKLLDTIDMKDNEEYLSLRLPGVFSKYGNQIDGIYITSGLCAPLCRYLEAQHLNFPVVTFDTHEEIKAFMKKGVISASVSQNVTQQMKVAFESLVKHIAMGVEYPPVLHTDVNLMLKSNMHQFD